MDTQPPEDPPEGNNPSQRDPLENFSPRLTGISEAESFLLKVKRTLFGKPRNLKDPKVFHTISLVAFLAWVGLGADGLSSSAYGPDESFRALITPNGNFTYLAVALTLATAFTVFIISYAYSRLIEHFPSGGGGYVVATQLIGPRFGVISGSALLVDYVLTISVSVAAGADQIFSVLPIEWSHWKLSIEIGSILLLLALNLRGVKESVTVLMPIFMVFIFTHAILIFGGIFSNVSEVGRVSHEVSTGFKSGIATLGIGALFMKFLGAYSMVEGTYTDI